MSKSGIFSRRLTIQSPADCKPDVDALAREVHIYAASLQADHERAADCFSILTKEEQNRALSLKLESPRMAFILSRAFLKSVLAGYTGLSPEKIVLLHEEEGKPFLEKRNNPLGIQFNLSHSGALAMIGITRYAPIGVDIQRKINRKTNDDIARRILSPHQKERYSALTDSGKLENFYLLWTAREAALKAAGLGLRAGFDSFSMPWPSPGKWHRVEPLNETMPGALVISFDYDEEYAASISLLSDCPSFSGELSLYHVNGFF